VHQSSPQQSPPQLPVHQHAASTAPLAFSDFPLGCCRAFEAHGCLVLSYLIRATGWADAPRWGGRLRCWLAAPLPLPQQWTCRAVQSVTRVPLSLYLGPRLVNVVSLAYKILTANHVLIIQPKGRTTDECSIRVPQMSGRQF
jgi:hypothetical protein